MVKTVEMVEEEGVEEAPADLFGSKHIQHLLVQASLLQVVEPEDRVTWVIPEEMVEADASGVKTMQVPVVAHRQRLLWELLRQFQTQRLPAHSVLRST